MIYRVQGTRSVTVTDAYKADDPRDVAKMFFEDQGVIPTKVKSMEGDEVKVICLCALCNKGILDTDTDEEDDGNGLLCSECKK